MWLVVGLAFGILAFWLDRRERAADDRRRDALARRAQLRRELEAHE